MKTEMYKKVFIKSEADLPNEEGTYNVSWDGITTELLMYDPNSIEGADEYTWLKGVKWYLQPLPEPEAEESDKEFAKIKLAIATIQWHNLAMNEDQSAIEANPSTHKITEYVISLLNELRFRLAPKPKGEDDLIQKVTNLIYYAHEDAAWWERPEFDAWVEEKTGELSEYYKLIKP